MKGDISRKYKYVVCYRYINIYDVFSYFLARLKHVAYRRNNVNYLITCNRRYYADLLIVFAPRQGIP